jgi:hypothetical protein
MVVSSLACPISSCARFGPVRWTSRFVANVRRRQSFEADAILIAPHFTMPSMMHFTSLRGPERRPYVLALREFAVSHRLALGDASARWKHVWKHLWKEGRPCVTLLRNGINHPDDRDHAIFADGLMKCLDSSLLRKAKIVRAKIGAAEIVGGGRMCRHFATRPR